MSGNRRLIQGILHREHRNKGGGKDTYRSSRSTGMPCGATMSVVPRTSACPRLVASTTVGAIGDSRSAFRYVKHSMSSMCTCMYIRISRCARASIKATDLINEHHARHDLRDALVDVALHDAVHLPPELIRHLRPRATDEAAHDAHEVLPTLRARVRGVEVAERDVLDELLALVHVALGERDVGLRLEVVRGCVGVAPTYPLAPTASARLLSRLMEV